MVNKMDSSDTALEVNERQREFYNNPKKNTVSKIWSYLRNIVLAEFRQNFDIKSRVYAEHRKWLTGIASMKVLDLGCLYGNHLSIEMARNAREYIGIDLSDKAIEYLSKTLRDNSCINARAEAVDFLSPDFKDGNFDLIYAFSVLHHFRDVDQLLDRLDEKLADGGIIISYDPLETSLPVKIARLIYRPFQSDKEWEWPFTRDTLKAISKRFEIVGLHGVLGSSKWSFLWRYLPLPKNQKKRFIEQQIDRDWNVTIVGKQLFSCMHVTMLLKKRRSD